MLSPFLDGRRTRATWAVGLAIVTLAITGCAPAPESVAPTPGYSAPVQTDAGAIEALIYALEALEPYAGTPDAVPATDETCAYLEQVAEQLSQGVPLDEYRALYEDIARDTAYVARRCSTGPLDEVAAASAVSARAGVVTILNDREVMGNNTWH